MKQAHFFVATIDGNAEQFHCNQGGDVDTQVRMIVAALGRTPEMLPKVLYGIITKYDLADELKEVVNHECN